MLTQLCAARKPPRLVSVAVVLALTLAAAAQDEKSDPLARGFRNPPDSAKPRVWWHWMNGNITKEGIKLDLEWMQRVGIGGFQNFDAALNTPKLVDHRLVYMTPEWQDAFRYATELADRLGLAPVTVRRHLALVLSKLGAADRAEALRMIEEDEGG